MFNFIARFITIPSASLYLGILFIMPFQWYRISSYSEIFPAFDLIIIYYLSTYKKVQYWHLFLLGLLIDQLYHLPVGISSLAFIVANFGLNILNKKLLLKEYLTNLAVFCGYSIFIIFARYLLITIKSTHHIEGLAVYFYFLTTIFSYPIMCILIEEPIEILGSYVG